MLFRNDSSKGDIADNLRFITLLNIEFKILARILANSLEHVAGGLVGEAQTYAILGMSLKENL